MSWEAAFFGPRMEKDWGSFVLVSVQLRWSGTAQFIYFDLACLGFGFWVQYEWGLGKYV